MTTEDDSAAVSRIVPADTADHTAMCVYVPAGTSMVTAEPTTTPSEAPGVHVVCLRAYAGEPPVASFAPSVPGLAVCREIQEPRSVYATARDSLVELIAMTTRASLGM
jgi:hypothetical protein